jgi:signal transduction histidine kinase
MTLRSRLALGLFTIAIILVGPLVFTIQSLQRLHGDARTLRREVNASLLLGRLREGLTDLRRRELALLFSKRDTARIAMDQQLVLVRDLTDSLSAFELPGAAEKIGAAIRDVVAAAPPEYAAALANKTRVADSISDKVFVPALNRADAGVFTAERELRNRTRDLVVQATASTSRAVRFSVAALILALVTAAAVAFWLTWSISKPVYELKVGMQAVADGELDYRLRLAPNRADEFGELAQSFQAMTRQLVELDKLKAEFVSVASHELKTPINVIVGYLQLLEEGIYGPLNDKQKEVHKTVGLQANTLLRLVKQLLDVSRFEAGGGRLEPRKIVLDKFLDELEQAFHVLAVQREVRFRIERRGPLPDEVYWDVDRINEVLGNLLANAFKFTPRGGTVTLGIEALSGSVTLEVTDTGAGIPPDQLPRIFDKFYQADNQRAAAASGSGLGLAIAKQIVEAHGGAIQCDSTPGVGTTFSITLPTRVMRRSSAQHALAATAV